jgi:micrococcal nuclease
MKRPAALPVLLTLVLLFGCNGQEAQPVATATSTPALARETGRVTRVIDGGTIEVLINDQAYHVRYIGMNTPETNHYWFQQATDANRRLVEGQTVYLEKDVSETDRSGRLLRYVYLEDGTFVNAELVKLGFAQVATYPPDVKHQDLFVQLQGKAREAGRGLWGPTPTEVPPATATPVPQPTATATQAGQEPG